MVHLGDVLALWEDQKKVCGGNHEEFAKHLLILHKAFCANFCKAESLQKKVLMALHMEISNAHLKEVSQRVQSESSFATRDLEFPVCQDPSQHESNVPDNTSQPGSGPQHSEAESSPLPDINSDQEPPSLANTGRYPPTDESRALPHIREHQYAMEWCVRPSPSERGATVKYVPQVEVNEHPSEEELPSSSHRHIVDSHDEIAASGDEDPTVSNTSGSEGTHQGVQHAYTQAPAQALTSKEVVNWRAANATTTVENVNVMLPEGGSFDPAEIMELYLRTREMEDPSNHSNVCIRILKKISTEPAVTVCPQPLTPKVEVETNDVDQAELKVDVSDAQDHKKTRFKKKRHVCNSCGMRFTRKGNLIVHLVGVHKERNPHVCTLCGKGYTQAFSLKEHMQKHTGEKPNTCPDCGKKFSRKRGLKAHMMTHTGEKPYKCPDCDATYYQAGGLKLHALKHTGEKSYICSECGQRFVSVASLKSHIFTHSGERPHMCSDCGRRFSRVSHLNTHRKMHTGERAHVCPDCGKSFIEPGGLKIHKMIHTGEKPYLCSECGKTFRMKNHLRLHMMTHTGNKPNVCPDCGKAFSQPGSLKEHTKTHTGEKPHACSVCDRGFSSSGGLRMHMRTHTREKPHVCIDCGEGFSRTEQLKTHMLTHLIDEDEKYHFCSDCGLGFSEPGALKSHMLTHTGERPHACSQCGECFLQSSSLQAHRCL